MEEMVYGLPRRRLTGHAHFVQDIVPSSDGQVVLSTLETVSSASGTKDVPSVAFSIDDRQIAFASKDRIIKLWNTHGECKHTIQDGDAYSDLVSHVQVSPNDPIYTVVLDLLLLQSKRSWELGSRSVAFGAHEIIHIVHPHRKADQELPLIRYAELNFGSSYILALDARSLKLDYLKTFSAFRSEDVAISYDEMFAKLKGTKISSDQASF